MSLKIQHAYPTLPADVGAGDSLEPPWRKSRAASEPCESSMLIAIAAVGGGGGTDVGNRGDKPGRPTASSRDRGLATGSL